MGGSRRGHVAYWKVGDMEEMPHCAGDYVQLTGGAERSCSKGVAEKRGK
jgi:hypothetical protein